MRGLEDLKKIDIAEISAKTYISVDELTAILNKEFGAFSKPKGIGFIKILEREYGVDLSELIEEFEEYKKNNQDDEKVFVVARQENANLVEMDRNTRLYIMGGIGFFVVFVIILYSLFMQDSKDDSIDLQSNEVVKEAVDTLQEHNLSNQTTKDLNNTKQDIQESKKDKIAQKIVEFQPYLQANKRIWVGITYANPRKKINKIINAGTKIDINMSIDQTIILGHGFFTIKTEDKEYTPNIPEMHKIIIKDKKIVKFKIFKPIVKKKKETKDKNTTKQTENNKIQQEQQADEESTNQTQSAEDNISE